MLQVIEPEVITKNEFHTIIEADRKKTIEDLYDDFFRFADVAPQSVKTYRQNLKPFFKYLAENRITEPTRESIILYRNNLAEAGKKPSTIKAYLAVVKIFFGWLENSSSGMIRNVAKGVKLVEKVSPDHKSDYLSTSQAKGFLNSMDMESRTGRRDFVMCSLILTMGLRTIEVERADIEHIHTAGGVAFLNVHGKGGKNIDMRIDPEIEAMLKGYLAERGIEAEALYGKKDSSTPIFTAEAFNKSKDGRIPAKSISRIVKNHLKKAGIESDRITAHSLRHTAAMMALNTNGRDLKATQEFLRHSDPKITQIYLAAANAAEDKTSSKIWEAIQKAI